VIDKLFLSNGNLKIGSDTWILNMGPAESCPSKHLNMCQLEDPKKCYALKAERLYPNVLPYRRRQREIWKHSSPAELSAALTSILERKRVGNIKYLRFPEAGDFESQADVDKMMELAKLLDLTVYGYTARKDLDYGHRPRNLIITGSGFMIDNEYKVKDKKQVLGGT